MAVSLALSRWILYPEHPGFGECHLSKRVASGDRAPSGEHIGVDRYLQDYRSEEHTSELQSLMRISYAVFCLKKKTRPQTVIQHQDSQQTSAKYNDHISDRLN